MGWVTPNRTRMLFVRSTENPFPRSSGFCSWLQNDLLRNWFSVYYSEWGQRGTGSNRNNSILKSVFLEVRWGKHDINSLATNWAILDG